MQDSSEGQLNPKNNSALIGKKARKTPQKPLISVVIPAFNEEGFLENTLKSVREQNYRNFELIVVDNNSKDKTALIARRFGAKVLLETRQGVGYARQKGFALARGEIIATTDADTIVPSNWLSDIVKEFKKDEGLVAFGGLYTLYSGPITARWAVAILLYPVWRLYKISFGMWCLPGANFAVRKQAFLEVGGFNPALALYEDADLIWRLGKIGKVAVNPDFKVKTSGRRYRNGLLVGLAAYMPSALPLLFFKKYRFLQLPAVRTEKTSFYKTVLLPTLLSFSIFVLLLSFAFLKPSLTQADEVKFVKEKIALVGARTENGARRIEKSFANLKNNKLQSKLEALENQLK